MDGAFQSGWYDHPRQGLIWIFEKNGEWVYVCYTSNGAKPVSRPRKVDPWIWALSEPRTDLRSPE